MGCSRRKVITTGFGLAGAALIRAPVARGDDVRFDMDPFTLGVASGYPEPGAVVLWTRLAPEPLAPRGGMPDTPVHVAWEVAEDERFRRVRRSGNVYATPEWAHSVHVEVTGLEPGRDYWYRFTSGGAESPVGRTRTAPAEGAEALAIAVASCQHYENGHYAAYAAMARDDLDLVLHVGDYIYENRGLRRTRSHDEPECYTLDDYRRRYAIYKSDPNLKAAHASCPWMVTWDDHEVDNNYADARSEQNDTDALFLARRANAYRAYYEHQPLPRRMLPLGAHQRLHARRALGGLAEVHMLDGRQHRSDQACGTGHVEPCDALYDAERTMLGARQQRWLEDGLAAGRARWKLLAQQTVLAHMDQQPGAGVAYYNDGWTGYPAARDRLVGFIAEQAIDDVVVLSGDIHAFMANDIYGEAGEPGSGVVASELVTTSISSAGLPQERLDAWRAENPGVRFARSDVRGYMKLVLTDDSLRAELVGVDDVTRADSGTHRVATFEVEAGRPGVTGPG